MFSKMLVALDQGSTCVGLFKQALALAQATGARLMLLSILEPEGNGSLVTSADYGYPLPLGIDNSIWLDLYRKAETRGLDRLRNFTDQAIAAGVSTEFTQIIGSPGREICALAKTWEADLILVGSHGRTGLSELLLGSVSNYVMHHAPCSVLVIDGQTLSEAIAEPAEVATAQGQ